MFTYLNKWSRGIRHRLIGFEHEIAGSNPRMGKAAYLSLVRGGFQGPITPWSFLAMIRTPNFLNQTLLLVRVSCCFGSHVVDDDR